MSAKRIAQLYADEPDLADRIKELLGGSTDGVMCLVEAAGNPDHPWFGKPVPVRDITVSEDGTLIIHAVVGMIAIG